MSNSIDPGLGYNIFADIGCVKGLQDLNEVVY